MVKRLLVFTIAIISASAAQARVFDITKETFAAYFLATGGGSSVGTKAVEGEAAGNLSYDNGVKYNYSGEFGFIYSRPLGSLRFGFEIFKPSMLETTAKNGATGLYSASSDLLGYAPKLAIEINVHGNKQSRSYISGAVGTAIFTMKNDYTLTAAGQSAFPGVSDHSTEAKGSSTLLSLALGYEGILTDTTTITAEFGYRQLKVDNFKYSKDVTTFSGAHSSGDVLQNTSGGARTLDFSGGFISIGFRFYL